MPSQQEIARKLKLSQATVSRALNNDNSLPLATRIRVRQLAMSLGYEPRRYAGRKGTEEEPDSSRRLLALVHHAPTLDGKYYSLLIEMIQGFIQAAAAEQLTLIVKEVENMESARGIVDEYCNNVMGAVTVLRYPNAMMDFFNTHFRCVSLNHRYDELRVRVVEPQQEVAFLQMFRYLHAKGHRRIGFVTVKDSYSFAFSRYAGYLQGAFGAGVALAPEWALNVGCAEPLEITAIVERIVRLRREAGVTAWLCSSGSLAKSLLAGVREHGLRVPEELSLAAFDDILTPTPDGKLLCGSQANYEEMAGMAIRVLRHPEAFAGSSVICCGTEFHHGNTVAGIAVK